LFGLVGQPGVANSFNSSSDWAENGFKLALFGFFGFVFSHQNNI